MYLLALILPFVSLASVGFEGGSEFQSIFLDGDITVNCHDPLSGERDFAAYQCVSEILEPTDYVHFLGPKINANLIRLRATREDQSVVEKLSEYNGKDGISKSQFNLWIRSLTQKPLLKFGVNEIFYSLEREGQILKRGSFKVTVSTGESRSCRERKQYFSSNLSDCRSSYYYCGVYFRESNYCR